MSQKKILFSAMIGNALEFYDFTLYGFFAGIIAPIFFPAENEQASIIASFGAFAIGFLARPIGGLIFGYIGDTYGRKKALTLSIILMATPTALIGLLPTYEQIGIFAPAILIACRLLQGLCAGGEYNGAGLFVVEHAAPGKKGLYGAILTSAGMFGAILSTIVGALCTQEYIPFTTIEIPAWSWRIPFVFGLVAGLIGYYIRKRIHESPEFTHVKKAKKIAKNPLMHSIKYEYSSMLTTIAIAAVANAPFYLFVVFGGSALKQAIDISDSEIMQLNTLNLACLAAFIILGGYLCDKYGFKRVMGVGAALVTSTVWITMAQYFKGDLQAVIICQMVVFFGIGLISGPMNALFACIYSVQSRYTGVAFSYTLGQSLFAGTAPYLATQLVKVTNWNHAPSLYVTMIGVVGFVAIAFSRILQKENVEKRTLEPAEI